MYVDPPLFTRVIQVFVFQKILNKFSFSQALLKRPTKETTYQCQYFELPKDRDYHLIASEPYIDNANVMHHIVVKGCEDKVGMFQPVILMPIVVC